MERMSLSMALRTMGERSQISLKEWGERVGGLKYTVVSSPIERNDSRVSTLVKLADAAGYDVMLVRRVNLTGEEPIVIDNAGKWKRENER